MTYVDKANEYIRGVLDGSIPACKWTKAACQRQVDDLERQGDEDFPYVFDHESATRVCSFVELMPHIKGEWAARRETISLEPSQCFKLTTVFGWLNRDTGHRRFIEVYDEEARKNAKSALLAAIANYMFAADSEAGAEIWSAATTRDQASIIAKVSRSMARKSPEFRSYYGVEVGKYAMSIEETDSTYQALSSDDHTLDGLSPHFAAVDELHAHRNRGVYDVLNSALASRNQPLIWSVTTAGFDQSGICFEVRTRLTMVLNTTLHKHDGLGYKIEGNTAVDETFWGIIYTIDEGDDFANPDVWAKANPLLGVSVRVEDMARMCRSAQQTPGALNNFLTKRLNVWCNAAVAFFDMRKWASCGDPDLFEGDFVGDPCIAGVDLASKWDFADACRIYRRTIDDQYHYYAFWSHYLPEDTVENSSNAHYRGWEHDGWIKTTPGSITDYAEIETDLIEDAAERSIHELAVDPFQATQFMTRMQEQGFSVVEVRPLVLNFSEPLKELGALVLDGRWHHNGDPVAAWMASNVEVQEDRKENIYPRKSGDRPENKIDGVVAAVMALNRWLRYQEQQDWVAEVW